MFTIFIVVVVYTLIGMVVAKNWYYKRHGVPIKIINGGADAMFSSAFPVSFIWPLVLILPNFRNPKLCRHPSHILARDQARREYEQFQAAVERDNRYR